MILSRSIAKACIAAFLFIVSLSFSVAASAQDGKALFSANCASCHAPHKKLTGPALAGVESRWSSKENLYSWIRNSAAYLKTGDPYAVNLYNEYNKVAMNAFPTLKDGEIDAILTYINSVPDPSKVPVGEGAGAAANVEADNSLLFGILTLILAVVALIMLQVNSNLKKLADDKAGQPALEPIPFWRNKAYIAMVTVVLFVVGGYLTTKGAMAYGRSQDYQPEQPIYYSHAVHAGTNQINCQYCHTGAAQGKQATIPSVNVCMNCHQAINEYKGEKMYNEAGEEVDGTAEIKKLYKYAGFEEGKPWDPSKAKPIEWVRIHNLPDHVYFNHAQHVKAGQVACQTCHGEIQKMGEVKQFTDLSMGWCVNCHRETKVQFKDNGFYSIYEKYHADLKSGKIDSTKGITVEKIGGTECQKCHY
ncbi:c-type cytochrome [Sediminibacterium sp.]|uniref:c-type cytochrome n=1 Tax=Sediminibacterium sp. TaxID=1917865 RepID=UPI00273702B7|nr:c-type cytochrome [Sediminibacterium sp.]MDP3393489.1 c-type cytochrome [Sediminibacterium sp.]MDP3568091.1 c-type cytochrome [Sediminibacterium sp.]